MLRDVRVLELYNQPKSQYRVQAYIDLSGAINIVGSFENKYVNTTIQLTPEMFSNITASGDTKIAFLEYNPLRNKISILDNLPDMLDTNKLYFELIVFRDKVFADSMKTIMEYQLIFCNNAVF